MVDMHTSILKISTAAVVYGLSCEALNPHAVSSHTHEPAQEGPPIHNRLAMPASNVAETTVMSVTTGMKKLLRITTSDKD